MYKDSCPEKHLMYFTSEKYNYWLCCRIFPFSSVMKVDFSFRFFFFFSSSSSSLLHVSFSFYTIELCLGDFFLINSKYLFTLENLFEKCKSQKKYLPSEVDLKWIMFCWMDSVKYIGVVVRIFYSTYFTLSYAAPMLHF